jgi:hypothetical protein
MRSPILRAPLALAHPILTPESNTRAMTAGRAVTRVGAERPAWSR